MALRVIPLPSPGAEDVVVAADGGVYTGTEDGAVYRVELDGSAVTRVADTGGRPLGIEILGDGRLLVCDARRGMLAEPGGCCAATRAAASRWSWTGWRSPTASPSPRTSRTSPS